MISLNLIVVGLGAACGLGGLITIILMSQLRRTKKEIKLLKNFSEQSRQAFETLKSQSLSAETADPFQDVMFEEETKKKLKEGIAERELPEKYRHASCLLKRGLQNEEIADVLHLSQEEIYQISDLVHIAFQVEKASVH